MNGREDGLRVGRGYVIGAVIMGGRGGVGSRRVRRRYLGVGLRVRVFNFDLHSEGRLERELNGREEAEVWAGRKTFGKFFCGTGGLM